MRAATIFGKILFVIGMSGFCLIAGALLGGHLLTKPGAMGWDALANALGGAFLGLLFGLVGGIVIVLKIKKEHVLRANLGLCLGLALEILLLFLAK